MRETFSYIVQYIKQPVIAMFFFSETGFAFFGNLVSQSRIFAGILRFRNTFLAFVLGFLLTTSSLSALPITDALKLKISNASYSDETVIRYLTGATENFDSNYDACKLFSKNPAVPGIYTKINSTTCLSINAYPNLITDKKVQLFARVGSVGTYTITATEPGVFSAGVDIFIENTQTSTFHNLRTNPVFTFNVSDTGVFNSSNGKFNIYFSLPVVFSPIHPQSSCIVSKKGNTSWMYIVKNSSNEVIASANLTGDLDTLFNLSPGTYYFTSYYGTEAAKTQTFNIGGLSTMVAPSLIHEGYKLFITDNNVTVDFENVVQEHIALSVYTLDGREVAHVKRSDVSRSTIPLTEEAAGIYIIKLQTDKITVLKKQSRINSKR